MSSSNHCYLPKAPPPKTITWGDWKWGTQTFTLWQVQSGSLKIKLVKIEDKQSKAECWAGCGQRRRPWGRMAGVSALRAEDPLLQGKGEVIGIRAVGDCWTQFRQEKDVGTGAERQLREVASGWRTVNLRLRCPKQRQQRPTVETWAEGWPEEKPFVHAAVRSHGSNLNLVGLLSGWLAESSAKF